MTELVKYRRLPVAAVQEIRRDEDNELVEQGALCREEWRKGVEQAKVIASSAYFYLPSQYT